MPSSSAGGSLAAAHVHLDRGDNQLEGMFSVACHAPRAWRRNSSRLRSPSRTWILSARSSATVVSQRISRPPGTVVMAHEEPHLVWQFASTFWIESIEHAAHRRRESRREREPPSGMNSVSPTKAAFADHMGHAGGCVAGRVHDDGPSCAPISVGLTFGRTGGRTALPSRSNSVPSLKILPKVS